MASEVEERERHTWHSFYEVVHFGYSTRGAVIRYINFGDATR
jgi:hypothetical protein